MRALFYRLKYGFAAFSRTKITADFSRICYGFAVFGGRSPVLPSVFLQSQSGLILTAQASNQALSPQ
jgi:hypothetical protein